MKVDTGDRSRDTLRERGRGVPTPSSGTKLSASVTVLDVRWMYE